MHPLFTAFVKAETAFQLTYIAYFLALLAYAASLFIDNRRDEKDRLHQGARILFFVGWVFNALQAYALIESGSTASTLYESLISFSFIFGLLALVVGWIKKVRLLGFISVLIVFSALTLTLNKAGIEITPLPLARQSAWFLLHVTLTLTGYLSATVAFIMGVLALVNPGKHSFEPGSFWAQALGSPDVNFEKLNLQWMRFGFLMLASGLIIGCIWAKFTGSGFGAWDPKENWVFLSWLVVGGVLHMHHVPSFKGRKAVWASVFAWGFILCAYFGLAA